MALVTLIEQLVGRTLEDYPATLIARLGTEVDNVVGTLDNLHIVFDNNDRMAIGNQHIEGVEQAVDVVEMETRSRLVEDKENTTLPTILGDKRCEFDTLALASRQGR